jgi:hypothetical protein
MVNSTPLRITVWTDPSQHSINWGECPWTLLIPPGQRW